MRLRPSSAVAAAAVAGAVAVWFPAPGFKELQADTYRLLYQGRWIAQHGIPHREVFTLAAAGRPFADQQWLAELFSYETWRIAGYAGLSALSGAVFAGAFALLAALMRRVGASVVVAIACSTLAVFGTLSTTFIRAQVFALPLFVAVLWLCLGHGWRIALVLPLLVLWANIHGSVLIGVALAAWLLLCAAVTATRQGRRRHAASCCVVAAAALLTPLATPYGTHVLGYYEHMVGNRAVRLADVEWASPRFPDLPFFQLVVPLALAAASLVAAAFKRRRLPWGLIGAAALTAVAAGIAMRNDVWLGIVASVALAQSAGAWLPTREASFVLLAGLTVSAVAVLAFAFSQLLGRTAAQFQSRVALKEVAATEAFTAAHPCASILGDSVSASALLWLDPRAAGRIGFDGELEEYAPSALIDWQTFQGARGPAWNVAGHEYQVLIGTAAYEPALTARLSGLRGASVLARDARGVAVAARLRPCAEATGA